MIFLTNQQTGDRQHKGSCIVSSMLKEVVRFVYVGMKNVKALLDGPQPRLQDPEKTGRAP